METKQTFTREIKGHFNLREPKAKKPTAIFFVVSVNGRQYKFSTGVKIYPAMWNKTTNSATISNQQTKQDNRNNKIVNERISEILTKFSDYKLYLCNLETEITDIPVRLKSIICKSMAKKETINTENMLENAFNYYYTYIKKETKESSKKVEWLKVKTFFEYIEEKKLIHNFSVFTQSGVNAYKQYLLEKGKTNITINNMCAALVRYINNVLCVNTEYLQYKLQPVKYVKLEDKRENEEKGSFPLNQKELLKLETCNTLEEHEIKYRDIFLLQCEIGWRVSDLQQLINGNYEEDDETIKVVTVKKGTDAYALKTERLKELLEKVQAYKPLSEHWRNNYDTALKTIAKKAGLDRIITYKDAKGVKHEKKVYEKISSHWARHTKVTFEHIKGTPKEIVIKMTGHKNTDMIDKVYTKLTAEEKRNEFVRYYKDNKKEIVKTENAENELFAYSELQIIKDLLISDVDFYHTEVTKQAIQKIKDISKLKDYSEVDKEKALEFESLIWNISKYYSDFDIFTMYQYKLKYFGIIDQIDSGEEINNRCYLDEIEYEKNRIQFQIDEWEKRNNSK
jgi:integrase